LFAAAALQQMQRILPSLRPVSDEGPLEARVEALVNERARLYERVGNVRRAALLAEPFSTEIQLRLAQARALKRGACERVFARELKKLPLEERIVMAQALGTAASFSTWDELRRHQTLSVAQAKRVMARMIWSLLEAAR